MSQSQAAEFDAIAKSHGAPDGWLEYVLQHAEYLATLRGALDASTRVIDRLTAIRDKQDKTIAELRKAAQAIIDEQNGLHTEALVKLDDLLCKLDSEDPPEETLEHIAQKFVAAAGAP